MEITKLAKTLGEAIADSAEFKKYRETELVFERDKEAQSLTQQYQKKQEELSKQLGRDGITPSEMIAVRQKMSREYAALRENNVIKEYLEAKNAAEKLLSDVNGIIRYCVTGEEQPETSGCSGNCGSCGGCR